MDFAQADWLDNGQPLQDFATSSLSDLDLSDMPSNFMFPNLPTE